jgi:hypothetical protein
MTLANTSIAQTVSSKIARSSDIITSIDSLLAIIEMVTHIAA